MVEIFKKIILRDLATLKNEVGLFRDEQKIWLVEKQISNSTGTLCVHLIGSLNHFIGAHLGDTGYVRDREFEFSAAVVARAELVSAIEDAMVMVANVFDNLSEEALDEEFPQLLFDEPMTTGFLLTHVVSHLNYHLGQVNYHRRLLDY